MRRTRPAAVAAFVLAFMATLAGCGGSSGTPSATRGAGPGSGSHGRGRTGVEVPLAGRIPPPLSTTNVYAADRPGLLSPVVRHDPALVYVPNSKSNTVDVISQRTFKVIEHFAVGALPQHVTPSWNLRTLYVTNDEGNSLTPIDPRTARPGKPIPTLDPYNMYFTPDGRSSSPRPIASSTSATRARWRCTTHWRLRSARA
jgi:YVTN family beta-propeller protein